jgi:hypothetical protein
MEWNLCLESENIFDMKITVFQDVTPCSLSNHYRTIAGISWIHLECGRLSSEYPYYLTMFGFLLAYLEGRYGRFP